MTDSKQIAPPYRFEARMTKEEFAKLCQFACRWSQIEHTIGNCLPLALPPGFQPDCRERRSRATT